MTDREKLGKLVAYLMRRMYAHNQMADIGSTGEIFDEKIENAKYEECKDTLNFIDSMQEELTIPDIVDEHYWEMLGEEPVCEDFKQFEYTYLDKEKDEILCIYDPHAGLVVGLELLTIKSLLIPQQKNLLKDLKKQ